MPANDIVIIIRIAAVFAALCSSSLRLSLCLRLLATRTSVLHEVYTFVDEGVHVDAGVRVSQHESSSLLVGYVRNADEKARIDCGVVRLLDILEDIIGSIYRVPKAFARATQILVSILYTRVLVRKIIN